MGNTQSVQPPAPWVPPTQPGGGDKASSLAYPAVVVEEVKQLSNNANSFMSAPSGYNNTNGTIDFKFDLTDPSCLARMEGAMLHDKNLSKWLPKLVPKRVSETDFWYNYFAHIHKLVQQHGGAVPVDSDAVAPEVAATDNASPTQPKQQQQQPPIEEVKAPLPSVNGADVHAPSNSVAGGHGHSHGSTHAHGHSHGAQDPPSSSSFARPDNDEEEQIMEDYQLRLEEPLVYDANRLKGVIRWGIIGVGAVCEIKSGPAFQKAPGSRLVAVMRRTPELAKDFARRHNVPKYYTSVKALVFDPNVDAVYIATPPGSHCSIALQVCAAGKPCYVEKPMARHYEECRVMVEQFARAQLPLFVGYYRRRLDRFIAARQIVRRFIGDITSVDVVMTRSDHLPLESNKDLGWRVQAEHSGGGLFMDLGSHTLDILDYLVGPLQNVAGDARTHPNAAVDVETHVSMTFRTASGAVGNALWDFCCAIYEDRLTIRGSRGALTMTIFGKDRPVLHLPNHRSIEYEHTYPDHVHQPLVESIVQKLRGVDVPEDRLSTGASAARTALVMDTVLRKFYVSRTDRFWTRPQTWDNKRPVQYRLNGR